MSKHKRTLNISPQMNNMGWELAKVEMWLSVKRNSKQLIITIAMILVSFERNCIYLYILCTAVNFPEFISRIVQTTKIVDSRQKKKCYKAIKRRICQRQNNEVTTFFGETCDFLMLWFRSESKNGNHLSIVVLAQR